MADETLAGGKRINMKIEEGDGKNRRLGCIIMIVGTIIVWGSIFYLVSTIYE